MDFGNGKGWVVAWRVNEILARVAVRITFFPLTKVGVNMP